MLCVLSAGGKMWKEDFLNRSAPGKSSKLLPLVALHGGPAWPHNYLLPLKHLVCHGISEVIFYDQAGCGDSQLPQDEDLADFPHLLLAVKSFKLGYSHWRCFGMDTLLKICSVKCYLLHLGGKRRSPQRVFALLEIITCSSATGSNSTNAPEKSGNSSVFLMGAPVTFEVGSGVLFAGRTSHFIGPLEAGYFTFGKSRDDMFLFFPHRISGMY